MDGVVGGVVLAGVVVAGFVDRALACLRHRARFTMLATSVVAVLLLAGCSSPTTLYYTLSAPPAGQPVAMQSTGSSTPVAYRINSVTIPAQVDDTSLVVRQSPDQLMVLTFDRWTAPLSDQLRDALSQALTREMGVPPLQNLASNPTGPGQRSVSQVSVDVQRFDLLPGQAALLDVAWQVDVPGQTRQSGQSLTCYSELRTAAAPGVAPLVAAQQSNVLKLAGQIGQALSSATVSDARCF
ncbi:hypothetical protein DBV39_00540 [Orrella marina]|uniref:ABC-type transport auxiliary lipoprotein component domain-containing protein n=2 Tax=Orrella marina TaxID=2163011 RepID=A0A2R4XF59_9BURK|nr:hypothetical protein DBV39_00540 [Orrella marina]